MRRPVVVCALLAACGGGGGDVTVLELGVQFPTPASRANTNSLHFWVLEVQVDAVDPPGCNQLVGDEADPYHPMFDRVADTVIVIADDGETATVEDIPREALLVYGEAVDFGGMTDLAGCIAVTPADAMEMVLLPMRAPGTFDCADPTTAADAPCDDGTYCTVGETCDGGECSGGGPRNCTFVADQCNAESCNEEEGCVANPLPNGTQCEDGAYCSVGDECQDGGCIAGDSRNCDAFDGQCRVGLCNEGSNACQSVIDVSVGCTDALYCTVNETCLSNGNCQTTARDCSVASDTCNLGSCSEGLDSCIRTPRNNGVSCTTFCNTGGMCDASGHCVGGTANPSPGVEGPAGNANCSDWVDNDCDGSLDGADPNCQ